MTLGSRFKFFREMFGYSQSQLAKHAKLELSLIQRIEQDRKDVLDLTLRQYYNILNVYYCKSHENGIINDYYFRLFCDFKRTF